MRIGLINEVHGPADAPPTWDYLRKRAQEAEGVGFDSFVFEDALLFRGKAQTQGAWESMTIAGALLASTQRIDIGQSVINSPYRSPALTASMATTLDEIGAGRYVFGIGAGNTADSDYLAFGFPTDLRFSRFAEAIQIIHDLLKTGRSDFEGRFYTVEESELVLRGPNPQGPQINIAAGGPKMLETVARFGDAWNWWTYDEDLSAVQERFAPILSKLEEALSKEGRASEDLVRTVDVYSIVPPGMTYENADRYPLRGSAEEIADYLLQLGSMGFSEARCDLLPGSIESIAAMQDVVDLVHSA